MHLKQRVPKLKGFTNPFRARVLGRQACDTLNELGESKITPEVLVARGVVRKDTFVKLARGEVATNSMHPHGASKAAEAAITAAGGTVTLITLPFKQEGKAGRPAAKGNQFTNR